MSKDPTNHPAPSTAAAEIDAPAFPSMRSAESLLFQLIRSLGRRHRKRDGFFWGVVSSRCGLGSTAATGLCRKAGVDPETGRGLAP